MLSLSPPGSNAALLLWWSPWAVWHQSMCEPAVPNDDHAAHGNGAHELSVVRSAAGLQQLLGRSTAAAEPAVLQPFIAHGDCMYKVRYGCLRTSTCCLAPE